MNSYRHRDALPRNYRILWYQIESVLGQGGFGVTYLAKDTNLDQAVAIKEYLPSDLSMRDGTGTVHPKSKEEREAYRWGLAQFLSEARTLCRFRHPNIVRVLTSFEHNNTAYMVMEYETGHDLETLFKQGLYTAEKALLGIFLPILDGLSLVHKAGFIHRDIKPANIYVRQDSSAVLLDFGSARQAVAERTHVITSLVSPGYAPFEQYDVRSNKQGPWTDIYAVGATLYQAISGAPPPEAVARSNAKILNEPDPYVPATTIGAGRYSPAFLGAVDYALKLLPADRPNSVQALVEAFQGQSKAPARQPAAPVQPPAAVRPSPEAPSVASLLAQAGAHYRAGRLVDPPGQNALACYRQTLTLEPQNTEAIDGLQKLRNHYLRLAEQAIGSDQAELAREHLRMADRIQPGTQTFRQMWGRVEKTAGKRSGGKAKKITSLAVGLAATLVLLSIGSLALLEWSNRRAERVRIAQQQIGATLASAEAHFQAGRLIQPAGQNAVEGYRKVLSLDPQHSKATQRVAEIRARFLALAQQAVAHNEVGVAEYNLEIAERIRQGKPLTDLPKPPTPQAKKKPPPAPKQAPRDRIAQLIAQAERDFRAGRLTVPQGNNALEGYRGALELDPHNTEAARGLERVVQRLVMLADRAIATGQLDVAALRLNAADDIAPNAERVKEAWTRLNVATEQAAKESQPAPAPPPPNPVEDLLAEATAHIEAQRFIEPPTRNALETYESILALDPGNADAKQGISQIQDHYIAQAEQAWAENRYETAREYLRIAESIDPGTAKIDQVWRKLLGEAQQPAGPPRAGNLF